MLKNQWICAIGAQKLLTNKTQLDHFKENATLSPGHSLLECLRAPAHRRRTPGHSAGSWTLERGSCFPLTTAASVLKACSRAHSRMIKQAPYKEKTIWPLREPRGRNQEAGGALCPDQNFTVTRPPGAPHCISIPVPPRLVKANPSGWVDTDVRFRQLGWQLRQRV